MMDILIIWVLLLLVIFIYKTTKRNRLLKRRAYLQKQVRSLHISQIKLKSYIKEIGEINTRLGL